mgnify:CR=1 FL=1
MTKDILIIDGYNVIFAWTYFKKLAHHNLEHARIELRNQLLNYGKYKGFEVILVFDGLINGNFGSSEYITKGFLEIYTAEGETADSYIEREVYSRKGKYTNVYVVTSDGAEQNQILGSGGLRVPARELQNNIRLAKEEERRQYTHNHYRDDMRIRRNELGDLLDPKVAAQLEEIRRGIK